MLNDFDAGGVFQQRVDGQCARRHVECQHAAVTLFVQSSRQFPPFDAFTLRSLTADGQCPIGKELTAERRLCQVDTIHRDARGVPCAVDVQHGGFSQRVVVGQVLIEYRRTLLDPVARIVQLLAVVGPPLVDELAVVRIFRLDHVVHGVPHGTCTLLVQEVAHVDGGAVDELTAEIGILHQSAEQPSVLGFVSPCAVGVMVRIIDPFDGVIIRAAPIQPQSEVGVLGNPAPLAVLRSGTPDDVVVAREVQVAVVQILNH